MKFGGMWVFIGLFMMVLFENKVFGNFIDVGVTSFRSSAAVKKRVVMCMFFLVNVVFMILILIFC